MNLKRKPQPLDKVEWIDPHELRANDYNPNRVFPPEMELLKRSILETGWTQPIVVARDSHEIVDGFHRWTLCCLDPEIIRFSGGMCPVVYVDLTKDKRMLATIRHNRARGQHGIIKMGKIVRDLLQLGMTSAEVMAKLGMEAEEVDRLKDQREQPDRAGADSFGKGWVPDTSGRMKKLKATR